MPTLAEHLSWHLKQPLHRRLARAVLNTPPLVPRDDGVVLFSQIGHAVLLPYLVAVKSLAARLGRGRVVILDDGTLSAADRAVLAEQLGDPEIRHIADVDTGPCPRGGTWERLLTILDLRARDFVIQLDSDTVTLGAMPEVAAAIDGGRSFTLRGEAEAALMDVDAFAAVAEPVDPAADVHVQSAAEAVIGRVAISAQSGLRYARGCSGFAGFAPSADGRRIAEAFSTEMDRLIGRARWQRWGSEQVTSSFVIANDPAASLLPYARYLNHWKTPLPADAALVHFVGTYRFHGRAYFDATRAAIAALRSAA